MANPMSKKMGSLLLPLYQTQFLASIKIKCLWKLHLIDSLIFYFSYFYSFKLIITMTEKYVNLSWDEN